MGPNYWRLHRNFTNHHDSVEEKQNKRLTGAVVALLRDPDERDPDGGAGRRRVEARISCNRRG